MIEFFIKKDPKKRSHLKNLVAIAKLDGVITIEEYNFLVNVGNRVGISESEIKKMIKRTYKVSVSKPKSKELILDYIYDLIEMTLVDGVVDEEEIDLTITIAEKIGLNPKVAPIIVRRIFTLYEIGKNKDEIIEILKSHLLI
jgi:uncharacterized tellurite resistance protein B-like protein